MGGNILFQQGKDLAIRLLGGGAAVTHLLAEDFNREEEQGDQPGGHQRQGVVQIPHDDQHQDQGKEGGEKHNEALLEQGLKRVGVPGGPIDQITGL